MNFTVHQQRVLDAFSKKDTDVAIGKIYAHVYDLPLKHVCAGHTVREMQQKLAPTFKVINDKLYKANGTYLLIEPGNTKQTYRLSTIKG